MDRPVKAWHVLLSLAALGVSIVLLQGDKFLVGFLIAVPLVVVTVGLPWIIAQRLRRRLSDSPSVGEDAEREDGEEPFRAPQDSSRG
jgi:hypothetical protein